MMMKLTVVDDYRKVAVVEADTIDTLKARIMECFFLKEEDLSQRLLVPDGRDIRAKLPFCTPMLNGLDLLELGEGSILNDDLICDSHRLLLGWKGPFIISLVSSALNASLDIEVDPYVTLGELKQKIEKRTGEPVTAVNLPRILFWGEDDTPLIFFGLYKYCKGGERMVKLRINRNSDNKPADLSYMKSFQSLTIFRTEPAKPLYFGEKYDAEEELKRLMVLDQKERILVPLTDVLMNPEKKMTLNRRYKEPAGCFYREYHPSKKRWKKMMNIIKEQTKKKRELEYREEEEGPEEEEPEEEDEDDYDD